MHRTSLALACIFLTVGCGPDAGPVPDAGADTTVADLGDGLADSVLDSAPTTEVKSETAAEIAAETADTETEVVAGACGNPAPTGAADFRVNDEGFVTTLGLQQFPHIAASQGGFTAVWLDTQGVDSSIWAQWFDSAGNPTGAAEKVSDGAAEAMKGPPRVAREFPAGVIGEASAMSVVVWEDGRADPIGDIYGQRHDDSNGTFLGGNFRVDDAPSGAQREATVSMWPTSPAFVVAWTDQRDGNDDIYVRRFDDVGAPLGASVRVNDDGGVQNQHSPDVARGPDGGFVVAWKDFRDTVRAVSEIWARRYDAAGLPIGASFQVDADLSGAVTPRVDIAGDGSFVITWVGAAPDGRTVRAQRYHADGSPDGDSVALSGAPKPLVEFPSVGMLFNQIPKAGYLVTWDEPGTGVHARCVDAAGAAVGEDVLLSQPVAGEQARVTLATVGVGNVNPPMNRTLVLWHDDRVGDLDIWGQELLGACEPSGGNRMVSGRADGSANQAGAAVAGAADGRAVVVWQDDRSVADGLDVWGRRLDAGGARVGVDFLIGGGVPGTRSDQRDADVAMAEDGSFVVAYTDLAGAGGGDVVARRFSDVGVALGAAFAVASENGSAEGLAAVAARADGTFAIAWGAGATRPDAAVWVRRFGSGGEALGPALRVDGDASGSRHGPPALAFEADGGLLVTWSDLRDGDPDVWLQRVTPEGALAGVNVRVTLSAAGAQILPSVAVSPSGEALVAWVDYVDSAWGDIRARRWGAEGPLESPFQVNDVDDVANPFPDELPYGPVVAARPVSAAGGVASDDATFVVTWTDYRAGREDPNIQAQGVAAGVLVGGNFRVDQGPAGSAQVDPDLARDAASPLGLTFVWTDDRAAADEGFSVWGRRLTCP